MDSAMNQSAISIKPMPFWQALLYFGLPAILFRISLYNGTPLLIQSGLTPFEASIVAFTVPLAILFAFAFGFYQRDGYPVQWNSIKTRFRLLPMNGKDWLWAIGGLVVTFLSIGMVSITAQMLITTIPAIAPPEFFTPWQTPGVPISASVFEDFIGSPLKGNWGVAILLFLQLFFNIFGEEL